MISFDARSESQQRSLNDTEENLCGITVDMIKAMSDK